MQSWANNNISRELRVIIQPGERRTGAAAKIFNSIGKKSDRRNSLFLQQVLLGLCLLLVLEGSFHSLIFLSVHCH